MPYIDSNIPKSIFYFALVGKFLRIARSSLLHKDFNEKAMEQLLNRMKAQGAQSLRCRKALSKTIRRHEKALLILEKIVMKFILKLDKTYYLMHGTLSAALSFCYIYFFEA